MTRNDRFAGTWYPGTREEIEQFIDPSAVKRRIIAGVCPHAGWIYSGRVAGEVFSQMEPADTYVLIGPNHHGDGEAVSVYPEGAWRTPLGDLPVNAQLAREVIAACRFARPDTEAHEQEHSLEVQLPFIKYFSPKASILPIALADYSPAVCKDLGQAIAASLQKLNLSSNAILIASTDMSHYLQRDVAHKLDHRAIEKVLALDPEGLLKTVAENDISMCGSGPTAAILWASQGLGAKNARLTRYATSGEVTGDIDQVVGYAGFIIY